MSTWSEKREKEAEQLATGSRERPSFRDAVDVLRQVREKVQEMEARINEKPEPGDDFDTHRLMRRVLRSWCEPFREAVGPDDNDCDGST